MSVKILNRTRLGRPTSVPVLATIRLPSGGPSARLGPVRNVGFADKMSTVFRAFSDGGTRKTADGAPPSILEKIREFITQNVPKFSGDTQFVSDLVQKLKVPAIAALGIAFVGGLAYLAYRLYKHHTQKNVDSTVSAVMADIQSTTPDLLKIPGWADTIRAEVTAAASAGGDPAAFVEKIAAIKSAVIAHQKSINPSRVGSGFNMISFRISPGLRGHRRAQQRSGTGGGIKVPI